jgi:solute:Na+ symporter, SSS family
MTPFVILLAIWCVAQVALGLWIARRVRNSADFFVAGRSLSAGAIFSTFLAANIGAGSTVAATALGYREGYAGWWWNGSAGLGTLVLAFWVGPRLWRVAREHNLYTVGDYLALRYNERVRGIAALLIWLGSFSILSGQLIGCAIILQVLVGWPQWAGALAATLIVTAYFSAGGLLSSAWVNRIQDFVVVAGFAIAVPLAIALVGGWDALQSANSQRLNFWNGRAPGTGWTMLILLGPSFFLSPGLIQRAFAARDEQALRKGVAWSGVALMLFAFLPMLLGMAAYAQFPGLEKTEQALPRLMTSIVPLWVGALALTAVFAAEISSADAVLFMLSTSGAQDLYRRFLHPDATDDQVLSVARRIAVFAGVIGYALTLVLGTVLSALGLFYSILTVSLFVPILATLLFREPSSRAAYASIATGISSLLLIQWMTEGRGYGWATPVFLALLISAAAFGLASLGNARAPQRI